MTTPYLDLPTFRAATTMPGVMVDEIETAQAGWVANQLAQWSSYIDARLRKRYAAPFVAPFPDAVLMWLTRIVTMRCYLRRGIDPNDLQFVEIKAEADAAIAELKEAADSETGLFDLPLLPTGIDPASGITKGGPYVYSETSPYVWTDVQQCTGRGEDSNGRGSGG